MRTARVVVVSFVVVAAGCAFGPGDPFGELQPSLDVRWVVPGERARAEGFARLASDYELRLDVATVTVEELSLRTVQGGGGGAAGGVFDPANPPPGYSLCHGGHCHRDDGAQVTYAQVEAELAGGGVATEVTVVRFPVGRTVDLLEGLAVDLACEPDCDLDAGTLSALVGRLGALRFEGVVRDSRAQPRIEGLQPFVLEVDALTLRAPLELELNRDEPSRVRLRLLVHLSPQVFDRADWAADPGLAGESLEGVLERLAGEVLGAEVSR